MTAPSAAARANHGRLFPGRVSTLAVLPGRIAGFEAQRELAASTDVPAGE